MDIHEYQAKKILSNFGVTIPRGAIPKAIFFGFVPQC